jgi:hypothetical protein
MSNEKRNILEVRKDAKLLVDKYGSIRKHFRNFAIISAIFAVTLFIKFGFENWYFYTPLIVTVLVFMFIRYKFKFKFDLAQCFYYGTFMSEEAIEKGVDVENADELTDFFEKRTNETK